MATNPNQRWYPSREPGIPDRIIDWFRQVLDRLYEIRDELTPKAVSASGTIATPTYAITEDLNVVPGCQIIFPRSGKWVVTGVWDIAVDAAEGGKLMTCSLKVGATMQKLKAYLDAAASHRAMVSQTWHVSANKGDAAKLLIQGETGVSASTVNTMDSTITAMYAGQ